MFYIAILFNQLPIDLVCMALASYILATCYMACMPVRPNTIKSYLLYHPMVSYLSILQAMKGWVEDYEQGYFMVFGKIPHFLDHFPWVLLISDRTYPWVQYKGRFKPSLLCAPVTYASLKCTRLTSMYGTGTYSAV